ncbi:MAG: hypothetical protein EOO38_24555 [Cytophagaceae bacterium]|nr:MAG: hypothetical protein EOO38_24555 [Cytophagaceae bacterium]
MAKNATPNLDILNSTWQMPVRRYGSSVTGLIWSFVLLAGGAASIPSHGVTLTGGTLCILGLAGLVYCAAFVLVARSSETAYNLNEWSKAVRERYGDQAIITLHPDGRVSVEVQGQKTDFPTPTEAIRVAR